MLWFAVRGDFIFDFFWISFEIKGVLNIFKQLFCIDKVIKNTISKSSFLIKFPLNNIGHRHWHISFCLSNTNVPLLSCYLILILLLSELCHHPLLCINRLRHYIFFLHLRTHTHGQLLHPVDFTSTVKWDQCPPFAPSSCSLLLWGSWTLPWSPGFCFCSEAASLSCLSCCQAVSTSVTWAQLFLFCAENLSKEPHLQLPGLVNLSVKGLVVTVELCGQSLMELLHCSVKAAPARYLVGGLWPSSHETAFSGSWSWLGGPTLQNEVQAASCGRCTLQDAPLSTFLSASHCCSPCTLWTHNAACSLL